MGINRVSVAVAGGLLLPLTMGNAATMPVNAGHDRSESGPMIAYRVTELEPLEGSTASAANSINDLGWAAGMSDLPGVVHATLWRRGMPRDLETLGGPNSAILWPNKNASRLVVGVAETDRLDPRGEQWSCSAFFPAVTGHVCRGFVWEDGTMRALPTFGGTHGFATGVNDRGLVVGWAETPSEDPTCVGRDQQLGFIAAVWDTKHGDKVRRLRPLPGSDSASSATAINSRGQVVGISGSCDQAVGRATARTVVLWNPGASRPIDLGTLGDDLWNTPMAINDQGTVVGFANDADAAEGAFDVRPFRWMSRSGMEDLGTLADDPNGQALGLNDQSTVVGFSRAAVGARAQRDHAVVWTHGDIVDLNDVTPGYNGDLLYANDINNRGVITGQALNAHGELVAYVATPIC